MAAPNIRIDIASVFKDTGFKKAFGASVGLESQLKKLGRTLGSTLSVAAITKFGKDAVKAFKEDEQSARRFEQALKGVNLGFASPEIDRYLEKLERQTAVTKGQTRPAFQALAQTTNSLVASQELLSTAIDVSAGSGYDLQTVANDLSKAYLGNTQGLSKYNLGLTKAELKTMRFQDIQKRLNEQFTGQRSAFLDTYAGKVSLVSASYERLQTTVGEGLVDAFDMLAGDGGIAGATTAMEDFGIIAADVIRGIAYNLDTLQNQFGGDQGFLPKLFTTILKTQPLIAAILAQAEAGSKTRLFFPTAGIGQPGVDAKNKAIEEARLKREKELAALRLKEIKQREKIARLKKLSNMLDKAAAKFDDRKAQLAAALRNNKITAEERKRLQELLLIEQTRDAIQQGDLEQAEKLFGKLDKLQSQTEVLANSLIDLKAGDPFDGWDEYFKKASGQISALQAQLIAFYTLANQFVVTEKGIGQPFVPKTTPQTPAQISAAASATTAANNAAVASAASAAANAAVAATAAETTDTNTIVKSALDAATTAILATVSPSGLALAESGIIGATSLANRAGAVDTAAIAAAALTQIIKPSAVAAGESGIIGARSISGQAQTIINNYIEGTVISQTDLSQMVLDQQYEYQRSGGKLTYNQIAI